MPVVRRGQGDQNEFDEKSPKIWPNPFLCQFNTLGTLTAKSSTIIWAAFVNMFSKTDQIKQPPNCLNFDQSGHPD
jgi:hypothetical protein